MATEAIFGPSETTAHVPAYEAFRLWAEVYDTQSNPMLALEQRFLTNLLPDISGADVVDVGCGTGRWLAALTTGFPKSLTGIDSSPEMLLRAASRVQNARLFLGNCEALPLPDESADIVLASFVVSYIAGLERFAEEVRRICRPGARVFITDVHPGTSALFGWKRAFRATSGTVRLDTYNHTLEKIVSHFQGTDLRLQYMIEPAFGLPERAIFEQVDKLNVFLQTVSHPAIYLMQLQKLAKGSAGNVTVRDSRRLHLAGSHIALGPNESISADVHIESGRIASLGLQARHRSAISQKAIDLSGYLLLPGLINSHDHLEFSLFPNLGRGPYANCEDWARDIHSVDVNTIEKHCAVPKEVRLWWGGIRNLLCGATSVCHHNPVAPELLSENFPIRVLDNFSWAHSLTMDTDVASRSQAVAPGQPFVLHLAEGVDGNSADELFQLDRMGALNEHTVIVHGLALTEKGLELLHRRGAALVWCPSSNCFLFHRTHNQTFLSRVSKLSLGTDSPLTATGDLLDEIRFASSQTGIHAEQLYRQVTTRAAQIFRLTDGQGTLLPGAVADMIAVRDTGEGPAKTLVNSTWRDVELVLVNGRVHLASANMMTRLPSELTSELQPLELEGTLRWTRAPLEHLFRETTRHLGSEIKLGGKQIRYGNSDPT